MPVNLRAEIANRLIKAEAEALMILGEAIVQDARTRAPVRKLTKGPRRKMGKLAGASLATRQFVRSQKTRMSNAEYQKFQYAVLYGRTRVARKTSRKPLVIGRFKSTPSNTVVTKTGSAEYDPATATVTLTAIYEVGQQGEPPARWVRRDRPQTLRD